MRKSWHEYFMDIAFTVASRSTCPKRRVGAVVVNDKKILSTGYNGSPSGTEHCDHVGCLLNADGNCIRTIHAEANAIAMLSEQGSTIYCTDQPCINCLKLIIAANIKTIYFRKPYENKDLELFLQSVNSSKISIYKFDHNGYEKVF